MTSVAVTAVHVDQLEAVYREEGDRLWHALLAFAGDADLASDAVAETFALALRRGADIRDPRAWVWKVGFRTAANELKRRASIGGSVPEGMYYDPEIDSELLPALAQLPPKQRAAVVLFYYLDASVRDIARRTGMSQLAVRANLSRGRKALKQILGDRDG